MYVDEIPDINYTHEVGIEFFCTKNVCMGEVKTVLLCHMLFE